MPGLLPRGRLTDQGGGRGTELGGGQAGQRGAGGLGQIRQVGSAQGRLTDDQGWAVAGARVQFAGPDETLSATSDAAGWASGAMR